MATLNGQTIDTVRLHEHAEAMFEALSKIASLAPETTCEAELKMASIARSALAPCHFFGFTVPKYGIACTDPEDMSGDNFAAWLSVVPSPELRETWKKRRWIRQAARDYVSAIHNPRKREYAAAYLEYLLKDPNGTTKPPAAPLLSMMGAQAVRIRLHELLDKTPPTESVHEKSPLPNKPEQGLLIPLTPFTQPALI